MPGRLAFHTGGSLVNLRIFRNQRLRQSGWHGDCSIIKRIIKQGENIMQNKIGLTLPIILKQQLQVMFFTMQVLEQT
jgi:hypothetical protein